MDFKKIFFYTFDGSYGSYSRSTKPEKFKDLESIFSNNKKFIPRGSGLSYSALSFKDDSLSINSSYFNRFISINKTHHTVKVESGVKIIDLINFLDSYGYSFPIIPGHPSITIGACVATDVHGKNPFHDGTFCDWIIDLTLFHPNHGYLKLSKNNEIKDITFGGLGLSGFIVDVTLKFINKKVEYMNSSTTKSTCINNSLDYLNNCKSDYVYSWHMIDINNVNDKGLIFESNYIKKKKKNFMNINKKYFSFDSSIRRMLPFSLFNSITVKIFNNFFYHYNLFLKKNFVQDVHKSNFPFGYFSAFHFAFGKKGFYEGQYLLNNNQVDPFIIKLKKLIKKYKLNTLFIVLKKFNGKGKSLSMTGKGILVSINFLKSRNFDSFFYEYEKILIDFDAQPNLTKDSQISIHRAMNTIKNYIDYKNKLKKFDPTLTFSSEVSERLKL